MYRKFQLEDFWYANIKIETYGVMKISIFTFWMGICFKLWKLLVYLKFVEVRELT